MFEIFLETPLSLSNRLRGVRGTGDMLGAIGTQMRVKAVNKGGHCGSV